MSSRRGNARSSAAQGTGTAAPWRVRFSPKLLSRDYDEVGHAAFEVARAAINKKLKTSPEEYGGTLRSPLQGLYKLKASHVRIVYHIERSRHEVWILMIGDRRDIWSHDAHEIVDRLGEEQRAQEERDREAQLRAAKNTGKRR